MAHPGHTKKMKALLLIVFLVGHEGVRVSSNVPDDALRFPFEAQWIKEQSEHCVWRFRGCVGRAGEACKYRPFALDRGPGCRLRNSYLLHDKQLIENFLNLELAVLTESADFFEGKCDGKLGAFQAWACLRRLGHIIRALNFFVRVQGSEVDITSKYGAAIRSHIEKASGAISSVLKDTKPEYYDLKNKVEINAVELAKDPVSSTGWIHDTVKQLASSNEAERMEGRNMVAELPSNTPQIKDEDLKTLRQVATKVSVDVDPRVESEAFRTLEDLVSFNERGEGSASLLQKSGGSGFPSKAAIVIATEIILVLLLIVTIIYSVQNQSTVPLGQFTGAMAGQIGTAAIVYLSSGVDFAAAQLPPQPQPEPPAQTSQQDLAVPQATQPVQLAATPTQVQTATPAHGIAPRGVRRSSTRRKRQWKTASLNRAEIMRKYPNIDATQSL